MKITTAFFIALFAVTGFLQAQTLFTYGSHAVSKQEFLEAYNKNPDTTGNKDEKLKQYLDLYINFRLKLQAAYDEKVNTNADLKSEAENFKSQLTESYINQQADINKLMHEAFMRSQKDILLRQVFVQFAAGNDTSAAYAQILKAYNDLKAGKNFETAAFEYSNDEGVKQAKGNIGYITIFTLPYSIENIVYHLKPGEFSAIYKSKAGYHIFQNVNERPALGRRKIEQLLFVIPPAATDKQKEEAAKLADSVYAILQSGVSFASMFPVYGHNNYEYDAANVIEVKIGEYNTDFENQVFSLKNINDISRPFKTDYGYNIIKLDGVLPVATDENDVVFAGWLQTQIQNDGRLNDAKNNLMEKWLGLTGFKESTYNKNNLWLYTDTALKNTKAESATYKGMTHQTVLFQFTKKKITVTDWINYLRSNEMPANSSTEEYEKKMHEYIRAACSDYYKQHIEDFDTAASEQIKEFNDANMLFYEMDKHVWTKASTDTAGLKKYYNAHKSSYTWKESVAALIISAPEKTTADSIAFKIKNNPNNWRNIVAAYDKDVYADSNRFDADQLPVKQKVALQKDFQTEPEANEAGDSYSFIHVLGVYTQPQQRNFDEAKGMVINDYQQSLEQIWLDSLKKTYQVKINDIVFNSLH